MDKDFEWGYREAELGDVGSQIEVGSDETGWVSLECLAVFPADIIHHRFVCRSIHNPKVPVYYGQSRVRYRLPYGERQAKCGIGVGDYVKLLRVPLEREDGWGTHAVSSMAASVGKVFEVVKSHNESGFLLKEGHWYPYFVLERVEKPALPNGRTVGDLADGEIFCTDEGRWFQANYEGDYGSDSMNKPEEDSGWVAWGGCHKGCRRAYLLHTPTWDSSYGKEVFHVSNPSERFNIWIAFSDGKAQRAVVHRGEDYRVFRLADLRVIPE